MSEDRELLQRYAQAGDEAAFAELVQRHISLVYRAALRQVGGDGHRAGDVTQSVFTDLARKARALAGRQVLASWLYTSTRYAAAKVLRSERRRQKHEMEAAMHETSGGGPDTDWARLRDLVDEVMHSLSERDRTAVVLRYFQNRPFADIGQALGLSEDAARMRVERALGKLRESLRGRGVTSTSAALGAMLATEAAAAAPAGLASSVTTSALASAMSGAGALGTVFAFMSGTKISVAIACLLAVGAALYQSNRASGASAAVAAANQGNLLLAARVAALEKAIATAERMPATPPTAPTIAATPEPASPAPAATLAKDVNARYRDILGQLTRDDPLLQQARNANRRERSREGYQPLFAALRFSPEQVERALDILSTNPGAVEKTRESFAMQFGPEAVAQLEQFSRSSLPRDVVRDFTGGLYYADEPLTPFQIQHLTRIVAESGPAENSLRDYEYERDLRVTAVYRQSLDWNKIVGQAEALLSPGQLQGLRSMAAAAHLDSMVAAAAKAKTTP